MSPSRETSGVRLVDVDRDRDGQRLDNFLASHLKGLPRSAVYRMIRTGQVRINGRRCKPASRVHQGDRVRVPPARLSSSVGAKVPQKAIQQISAATLYESADLLVVNKPAGMAVHAGSRLPWGLIDAVRQARPDEYLELVHRLDRETSGCLMLARNGGALRHYSALLREGRVQKHYLCLLDGLMREARIQVDAAIRKTGEAGDRTVAIREDGKPSLTRFTLLERYADSSYAEADLLTGRTHQIRMHACHIGLPLAGDAKYSDPLSQKKWKSRGLRRLFLHAHHLVCESPAGELLEFSSPLPASLRQVLDGLSR